MLDFGEYQFTCAICQRAVRDYKRNGRDRHVAPVCRGCENPQIPSGYGYRRARGSRVTVGAFMDRRKLQQVFALADQLGGEASFKQWSARNGRA